MRLLAHRMGLKEPSLFEDDEAIARSSLPDEVDWKGLKRRGWLHAPRPHEHPASVGRDLRISTGLGGPEAFSEPEQSRNGKLRLLTAKAHYFVNSTFANMPRQAGQQGRPTLEMHPEDAERRELEDGAEVIASNAKGSLTASLRVTDDIVEGTTVLEGKWWWNEGDGASPVTNRLAGPCWTPGGQPAFNDIFVDVFRPAEQKEGAK